MRFVPAFFFVWFLAAAAAFVGVGTLPTAPDPEGRVPLPFFTIAPDGGRELPRSIGASNVVAFSDLDESVHRLHQFALDAVVEGETGGRIEIVLRQTPDGAYVVALSDPGGGGATEVTFSRWDGFQHGATLARVDAPALHGSFRLEIILDGPRFLVRLDGVDVLLATDSSYDRGAVFVRAKRGSFALTDLRARGVGPDGEPYQESAQRSELPQPARDRALLLLVLALATFAFARFSCVAAARVSTLADASLCALAIALSPAFVEYTSRPAGILVGYAVGAVIATSVLGFRLRSYFAGELARPGGFGFAVAAVLASLALGAATIRRDAQDDVLAELAAKTAATTSFSALESRTLEPGMPLAVPGPFADARVKFEATLEEGALLEARVRASERRAAGVALVLATDSRLGCGFFRQDVTHDEAIGPRAAAMVAGHTATIEIECRGPRYRARIDGEEIAAADGRHLTGAVGLLVPRGRVRIEQVSIEPLAPATDPEAAYSPAGVVPGMLLAVFAFLALRFGARYPSSNALGLTALVCLPFSLLRGDNVELRELLLASLAAPSLLAVAFQNASSRIGAPRFLTLIVSAFVVTPMLALVSAADSRGGKDFDSLGRCDMGPDELAILHPKVRQLNDWFAWHEFRGEKASLVPPRDRIRIVALGSSSTWGFGLSDRAAADWPNRMEPILEAAGHPVEVLNAGVPGGVAETLFLYFEHVLVHYRPDIVTLSLTHNDAYELTQLDIHRWLNGDADTSSLRRLARLPSLAREKSAGKSRLLRLRDRFGEANEPTTQVWRELGYLEDPPAPVARFESVMRRFADLARQHGIRLVFVQEPLRSDRRFLWKDEFRDVMARVGAEYGFTVAKPQERLATIADHTSIFIDDVHPTAPGYALVAEAIAEALRPDLEFIAAKR